jgi:hypothetical protein
MTKSSARFTPKEIETVVGKAEKSNGVGFRFGRKYNGVGRRFGRKYKEKSLKKYLGPVRSDKPEPRGRIDWIGESVRRMKKNAKPQKKTKPNLTVNTDVPKVKGPTRRKTKEGKPMDAHIPIVRSRRR